MAHHQQSSDELDTDALQHAILQYQNIPDRDTGQPTNPALPGNYKPHYTWHGYLAVSEEALKDWRMQVVRAHKVASTTYHWRSGPYPQPGLATAPQNGISLDSVTLRSFTYHVIIVCYSIDQWMNHGLGVVPISSVCGHTIGGGKVNKKSKMKVGNGGSSF